MPQQAIVFVVGALSLVCCASAMSQVEPQIREKLTLHAAVIVEGQVYAMAAGPVRGTRESSEDFLVTRAMRLMANKLCEFEALPGKRLEAGITGVTLLSSISRGKDIEVVIRAPFQKPACKVTVVDPVQTLAPVPVSPDPSSRIDQGPTRLVEPSYIRSQGIVIRSFGGEY